ncbi:phage tail protein [Alkalihalobacillus gibsonii]|nr:phage tail protein [Alkalicoccobacillus gibsonii]
MYTILDPDLRVCGVLDLEGNLGCKFYNDLRSTKIADDQGKVWLDTLQLSVPYGFPQTDMMTSGYHLLVEGNDGYHYCYRIYNWQDEAVGPVHVKTVQAYNLAIWDFNHKIVPAKTFSNANSTDAFSYILQGTGWQIGTDNFFGGDKSLEIGSGNNAQYWLDQLISQYEVEVRAYVQVYNGQVVNKLIDIVPELGESNGRRLEYSHDLTGITRTGDDTQLYTLLHVYGGNDKNGNPTTISSVNGGKDYVVDDEANDLYNNGGPYLEGYITNDQILNPSGLLDWGKKQLANYNHPKYTYNVSVAHLDYEVSLGDHIRVVDYSMQPELTLSARVIQYDESKANPENTQVVIGEYVEIVAVTPAEIWALRAQASQAQQAAEEAKSYKVEYFTPDGTDFADGTSTKRIIIRVYSGMKEVTTSIDDSSYVWQKINPDGSHDLEWESSMVGVGNIITVGSEVAGSTIRCQVNDGISSPILFASEEDAAYFATLPLTNNSGDVNKRVAQYAQVDAINGNIYWSQEYSGPKKSQYGGWQSYNITRTSIDGTYKDQMWVIGGGHGSQFGIEHVGSDIYIWSAIIDTKRSTLNGTHYWGIARFKYIPNKVIQFGDSNLQFYMIGSSTKYHRINYDEKNQYIFASTGEVDFYVCKRSDIERDKWKPIYTMSGDDVGFDGKTQTFQSSALDFPYAYFCAGDVNGEDPRIMYCCDIRSKSLVYSINYTFDKGTINQIGKYDEPECISYYYDTDGKKWVIQGFSWGNEDTYETQRTNQLYRLNEHKRGEES